MRNGTSEPRALALAVDRSPAEFKSSMNSKNDTISMPARSSALAINFPNIAQLSRTGPATRSAFLLGRAVVLVWVVTGPLFNYSDTWQLVINTGTTIVTFLMVFLIQNTQNRDTLASSSSCPNWCWP